MELWIRSQDKTILMKIDNLLIDDDRKTIYTNNYINGMGFTYTLGIYKSKERALQILDEIQHYLETVIDVSQMVYEMPKE
jgi:hypothetical protein